VNAASSSRNWKTALQEEAKAELDELHGQDDVISEISVSKAL
jgi:hypothetical protein